MNKYARHTKVPVARSKQLIESHLMRFGASEFGYWCGADEARIGFMYRGVRIEMHLPLPAPDEFTQTPAGKRRTKLQAETGREQEIRRRWRSLEAVVKALLIGVDDGVLSFEDAFMPWITWGNGRTTSQLLMPILTKAIENGKMPTTLMLENLDRAQTAPTENAT